MKKINRDLSEEIPVTEFQDQPAADGREKKMKKGSATPPDKKKKLFIPIGFKMITITSLIVITSLAGVAVVASFFFRSDNEVRAMEDTLRYSTLISKKVKSDIISIADKTRMTLINISDDAKKTKNTKKIKSKKDKGEAVNTAFADNLFQRDPDLLYIAVLKKGDTAPQMEFRSNMSMIRDNAYAEFLRAEKPDFDRAFRGDEVLMNPSVYLNEPVVGMAIPFEIVDDRESIMIVLFSMDRLTESIKSQSVVKSYIVNGRGDIISHYDPSIARAKVNLSSLSIVKLMMTNPNPNGQTFYNDERGERHLGAFQRIGFTDAAVISTVPEKTAFAAVYKIQRIIFFITVIALGSAVIFIYIFSKTLTGPLGRLMKAASTIEQGDFSVVIEEKSRDEIGKLSESFMQMARGLTERENIKDAFGKFVNRELADLVMKGELKLGGERKEAAVFFSDIRSFTAISENLEPEEVVEFLNEYMTIMVDCVNRNYGSVDKFIGDSIMAIWGAPLSHGNDTENAINGALMMRKALLEFNKNRGSEKKPVIKIGCGINTGPVLAGQIGSQEKMEYTVIGDTVNLASRIESLNKPFGTDILISRDSYQLVKDIFLMEPMKKIKVKGKTKSQQIYAVLKRLDDPDGPKNLRELRKLVGIDYTKSKESSEEEFEDEEVKYEILD